MAKYLVTTRGCSEVHEAKNLKEVKTLCKELGKGYKKILVYQNLSMRKIMLA